MKETPKNPRWPLAHFSAKKLAQYIARTEDLLKKNDHAHKLLLQLRHHGTMELHRRRMGWPADNFPSRDGDNHGSAARATSGTQPACTMLGQHTKTYEESSS